jgi:glucuronosyltransferase
MYNLINGLAMFLLQINGSSILLAFRKTNYNIYQAVLKNLENDEIREVLQNEERVRIENGFVQQKWILQQNSVKIFLSHCGMGSCLEALYFIKPILCMPFNMNQFSNAIRIDNRGVGQSLFVPLSLLRLLINPSDFAMYTFATRSVTNKILALWMNISYEKAARLMSLEMKHAGGLKRAVEDIEFFVNFGGDLDLFAPFQSTLPFYQRYMLDLLLILVILPGTIITYIIRKCCKRHRKTKID